MSEGAIDVRSPRPGWLWASYQLVRCFGLRWIAYRLNHAVKRKTGWVAHRNPITSWDEAGSALLKAAVFSPERLTERLFSEPRFFVNPDFASSNAAALAEFDEGESPAVDAARKIRCGTFSLFHAHEVEVGLPPRWHENPFTKEPTPRGLHWSRIGDFNHGDIKCVWDLSRFQLAFTLARAYARTGDEQWPELFWLLVEDWRDCNPPHQGANWKCGQEIALRSMAWTFGLFAMARSSHTTPQRVAMLAQMLAVSAERIMGTLDYALSQRNNHGISEAAGLFTIGTLLPEAKRAQVWRKTGSRALSALSRELIYEDGASCQHSWNYHRLMLQCLMWAIRVGEVSQQPLDTRILKSIRLGGELLHQMMDLKSGGVPCYGQNDGSLFLSLNDCGYFVYRPVVQAASVVAGAGRLLPAGPWDEDLHWLFSGEVPQRRCEEPTRSAKQSPVGGYVVLRSAEGFLTSRAAKFRHRPAQADMLHVDIWWKGRNVAIDPGTYSYNAPPPWNNPFADTAHHNTVMVDGLDQMTRISRFVWVPFLSSRSAGPVECSSTSLAFWQGEHDGYQRLSSPVRYRRAIIRLPDEQWLVLDHMTSTGPHTYRLHWLFADCPFAWSDEAAELTLQFSDGNYQVQFGTPNADVSYSLVRGDESSPRGWRARGYQNRIPAISLAAHAETDACTLWSLLGPKIGERQLVTTSKGGCSVKSSRWQASIEPASDEGDVLVNRVKISGEQTASMEISS